MFEATWAYWAVVVVVVARDEAALAYGMAYVAAASIVSVELNVAREALRPYSSSFAREVE